MEVYNNSSEACIESSTESAPETIKLMQSGDLSVCMHAALCQRLWEGHDMTSTGQPKTAIN
jgi:hypothetical protein